MMTPTDALKAINDYPLVDVRSPGEYTQGHIPGAINMPLFSDEERAKVGTVYKQEGKEAAMELGLHVVGPKLATFVQNAKALAPGRKIMVHCWRGGQRSGSMAWLFRQAGFEVDILEGGYKAYRHFVLEGFKQAINLIVLGGSTGSGKTKILQELEGMGEQILDLEALAHHKGSAFGFIGELPQPTVEQFENNLQLELSKLNSTRRIWVENESHSIGRVFIPEDFWQHMKRAPLVNIEIPIAARIENLLADYVLTDRDDLKLAFQKIDKKLGGQHYKAALEALDNNDFAAAARIALHYYDKTYQHCLEISTAPIIHHLKFDFGHPDQIARELIKLPSA